MSGARHEQAVSMLTGLERFVRLVVERDIPFSQANTALQLTPSEKSPRLIGGPKPYTGLYSANSYMANRPGYTGYRRSMDADKALSPSPTSNTPTPPPPGMGVKGEAVNGVAKMNGLTEGKTNSGSNYPQPAPRQSVGQHHHQTNQTNQPNQQNHPTSASPSDDTKTTSQEDIQVPKPITNEDFQAMIPAHFLRHPTSSPSPDSQQGPVVTVTIKQPDNIPGDVNFPPAPTALGKVTEVITKSTLTETVVTRVTDNHLVLPVIIEVRFTS